MSRPKPYHSTVLSVLGAMQAQRVLDAPCGDGWLGRALQAQPGAARPDGLGLWEFPGPHDGYGAVGEHDLDEPLAAPQQPYDAVVCCEAIHLVTNPGVLLHSFKRQLRPGGRVVISTPNTWYTRSRLQFFLRGFHSGFAPMVGKRRGDYITYFPFSFPQLHLLLTHCGFEDVRIHEVDERKPKRAIEHLLALPGRMYCAGRLRRAADEHERQYWRQAGGRQAQHGRWLVVSAARPAA
ncbi:methyltransferase domain-containing protein [Orrella sp. JC864]|uniref:methyltransferase domain-containing protein n=1 Tax=Orrella sp. JC864 TaxID=3120298 RepID=UPI00300916F9